MIRVWLFLTDSAKCIRNAPALYVSSTTKKLPHLHYSNRKYLLRGDGFKENIEVEDKSKKHPEQKQIEYLFGRFFNSII